MLPCCCFSACTGLSGELVRTGDFVTSSFVSLVVDSGLSSVRVFVLDIPCSFDAAVAVRVRMDAIVLYDTS